MSVTRPAPSARLISDYVGQDRREDRDPPLCAVSARRGTRRQGRAAGSETRYFGGETRSGMCPNRRSDEGCGPNNDLTQPRPRYSSGPAQAVRRSAGAGHRLRYRPSGSRPESRLEIKEVADSPVQLAMVIGAGNMMRGSQLRGTRDGPLHRRPHGDARHGHQFSGASGRAWSAPTSTTRVMSAIAMQAVCEPYIRRRAIRHLEKGRVVIFAAGTGNPYFTTDSAASLRAMEIGAEIILKASHTWTAVYDRDPLRGRRRAALRPADLYRNIKTWSQGDGFDRHLDVHGPQSAGTGFQSAKSR